MVVIRITVTWLTHDAKTRGHDCEKSRRAAEPVRNRRRSLASGTGPSRTELNGNEKTETAVSIRGCATTTSRRGKCSQRAFARFRRRVVQPRKIAGRSTTPASSPVRFRYYRSDRRDEVSTTGLVGSYDDAVDDRRLCPHPKRLERNRFVFSIRCVSRASRVNWSEVKRKVPEAGVSAENRDTLKGIDRSWETRLRRERRERWRYGGAVIKR